MEASDQPEFRFSVCPHDCPSTCGLSVEVLDSNTIGRVRGAKDHSYTAGVICEKVARYAERAHHPDRLTQALRRTGAKGDGNWQSLSVESALDEVAEALLRAERLHGAETVWPYYFAGTMGLVQRDGIQRLRHVKGYSNQFSSICTNMAWTGYVAGTGKLMGPDPREMAETDLLVIWGTNAVATQVNVMTLAARAKKERKAPLVVVDIYDNATMQKADLALRLRPGTDGALACAVMHCLFRDGKADWDYLRAYSDCPDAFAEHLKTRTPQWAAGITGLSVEKIEQFAKLLGDRPRAYLRLGYGFGRQRNGAVNVHAASCIATVLGAWQHRGGGAFQNNGAIYTLDTELNEANSYRRDDIRYLDQSQIGRILTGDAEALRHGPPVNALFIQNTNPVSVAPEQELVKQGFLREDLFTCVHEQFMTETAELADIILPATMFTEHDDVYRGGGQMHLAYGPKLVDPPGECLSNHAVICGLAERLGLDHPGFRMTEQQHIDAMVSGGGLGSLEQLKTKNWIDCQPDFETAHFSNGFATPDGKFHFKPDWGRFPAPNKPVGEPFGDWKDIPPMPDHWSVLEDADEIYPYRLATSPARTFLNSTFTETPGSLKREKQPTVLIHPEDAGQHDLADEDRVTLGNERGTVIVHAKVTETVSKGVLIVEGIWPNHAHDDGRGINTLVGADAVAPYGGAAFHDNHVWLKKL
ncbi:molybdopterin oxidoreductase family protein [Coralliovum pocilloporae]|uniref:molybdopterin oxidoreductase family protein n=1 Tax=Coralliovum pocilloporae TaxID=3066369 RepID=UPI003306E712